MGLAEKFVPSLPRIIKIRCLLGAQRRRKSLGCHPPWWPLPSCCCGHARPLGILTEDERALCLFHPPPPPWGPVWPALRTPFLLFPAAGPTPTLGPLGPPVSALPRLTPIRPLGVGFYERDLSFYKRQKEPLAQAALASCLGSIPEAETVQSSRSPGTE